jgi:hypothetical protein
MSDERHLAVMQRAHQVMAHASEVMARMDERSGPVRDAARRERQRLNADLGRRVKRVGIGIGVVSIVTIAIGLFIPIGMFGFLAAVGLAIGIAAVLALSPSAERSAAAPSTDLPNGQMVQRFDSYLYRVRRALPAPAQAELDGISALLPTLRQTLDRVEPLDPNAQDARRLMSIHLPGLVERYLNVPAAYRKEEDGEGKTVDERLIEGLAAARNALGETSEQLARGDLAAFETQGRFMKSRYGDDDGPQPVLPPGDSDRDKIEG